MTRLRTLFASLALLGLSAQGGAADGHAPVLLTVTGADAGAPVTYDMAALEALGPQTVETTTIWTEGVQNFTGVPLHVLLAALGIRDGVLHASAINDYTIEIPVSDAVPGGPMIAYKLDGVPMSVRDKGPLWIVYPYDSDPDYRSEVIYSRSIWQLDRIERKD
jgi:hypothetical protein